MAKVFEKIMEISKKKSEEQRRREERLKELEEAGNRSGFHFPNPIQMIKDKKEIKELRREIAEYKENQRRKWMFLGLGCCMLVLFIFVGIMAKILKKMLKEKPCLPIPLLTQKHPQLPKQKQLLIT